MGCMRAYEDSPEGVGPSGMKLALTLVQGDLLGSINREVLDGAYYGA